MMPTIVIDSFLFNAGCPGEMTARVFSEGGIVGARLWMDPTAPHRVIITDVEVREASRRQGIGRKLFRKIEERVYLGQVVTMLSLGVEKGSWVEGWYRRMGYADEVNPPWELEDGYIWLTKSLYPRASNYEKCDLVVFKSISTLIAGRIARIADVGSYKLYYIKAIGLDMQLMNYEVKESDLLGKLSDFTITKKDV